MIYKDLNRNISVFQLRTLVFKIANNNQQLLIVDLIVILDWSEVLTIEGYRVKYSLIVVLRKNTSINVVGRVSL